MRLRKTLLPVLLAILLALAGCNAGKQQKTTVSPTTEASTPVTTETQTPSSQPNSTLSPSATTEPEPNLEPPAYPTGIQSPTNVSELPLFATHVEQIDGADFGGRNFSFQARYDAQASWISNGTVFAERHSIINGSETEYSKHFWSTERSYNQSSWRNDTHLIIRNTPTSEEYPLESEWTGLLLGNNVTAESATYSTRIYEVATELNFEVVQRGYTAEGEPRIILEHNSQKEFYSGALRELIAARPIEGAQVRLGMRPDGLITNVSWSFRGDFRGEPGYLNASWNFEYGDSGKVRPDWLDSAIVQEVKIKKVEDNTYELTNIGTLSYPSGSSVFIAFSFGSDEVRLEEPLSPGESTYFIFSGTQFTEVDEPANPGDFTELPDQVQAVVKVDRMRLVSDSSTVD